MSTLDKPAVVRAFGRWWQLTTNDIFADFTREALQDEARNYIVNQPTKHTAKMGLNSTLNPYYHDIVSATSEVSVKTDEDTGKADNDFLQELIVNPGVFADLVKEAWTKREYHELRELHEKAVAKNPQWYEVSTLASPEAEKDAELQADVSALNAAIEYGGDGSDLIETPDGNIVEIGNLAQIAKRVSAKENAIAKKKGS